MNKILVTVSVLSLLVLPFTSFADSTVNASADSNSSITPSGTVVVPTGDVQNFSISANQNYKISSVTLDGVSQGAVNSLDFTGVASDPTIHSIDVTSVPMGGGGQPWCSGPTAPGWTVGLPHGGCPVFVPSFGDIPKPGTLTHNADGSYTLSAPGFSVPSQVF